MVAFDIAWHLKYTHEEIYLKGYIQGELFSQENVFAFHLHLQFLAHPALAVMSYCYPKSVCLSVWNLDVFGSVCFAG